MNRKKYFLIGIGGAGMSAIALVLKGMDNEVAGSDIKKSRYTAILENEGIEVFAGHHPSNLGDSEVVVYSAAIPHDNVELAEARERGLKIMGRSDILAQILNSKKGIAISGTHGKTTTTSMVSLLLRGLGLDPTIIIGGELNELGSNARCGQSEYVVAEACESDGSFLKYKPFISVITNIEDDHMDYYKDYGNLEKSFLKFMENTDSNGSVIINGDEVDLTASTGKKQLRYGFGAGNDLYARDISYANFGSTYTLVVKGGKDKELRVRLNVPGKHNVKNSLAALSVCYCLGLDMEKAVELMQFFTGVKRRFEKKGEKRGALIFDDYAHHPSEVRATLTAAAQEKKNRVITVFQPHRYSRLSNLLGKFGNCFSESDVLIVTDVYGAGEHPLPGINGKAIIDELAEEGFDKRLIYIPKLNDVSRYLEFNIKKDDMVLLMGAGDITRVTEELLKGDK
ncbi:MAG: UDP-N-acetylmuramate--L-alanine ligase [Actinomycetota bacterium]